MPYLARYVGTVINTTTTEQLDLIQCHFLLYMPIWFALLCFVS